MIRNLLIKIGLIEFLKIELDVNKLKFFEIFRNNVDGSQSLIFDLFSSSKNQYKGTVNIDGFQINHKLNFFDSNRSFVDLTGSIEQKDNKLLIETEINAFSRLISINIIMIFVIYLVILISYITIKIKGIAADLGIPFIIISLIFLFLFLISYLFMKRSVTKIKYEFERDLYFMTKK